MMPAARDARGRFVRGGGGATGAGTKASVKWHGQSIVRAVERGAAQGVLKASEHLKRTIMRRLSVSSRLKPGARNPGPRARKPMKKRHSMPGQPPRSDTGMLRRSMFRSFSRPLLLATVGTTLKYGAGLEVGTKPHVIRPRRKKVLVFPGTLPDGTWGWIFTRKVRHPGTKPRPFIRSTLRIERRRLLAIIRASAAAGMRARRL